MRFLESHKWSTASIGLSLGSLLLALSIGAQYAGEARPELHLGVVLGLVDFIAILGAFVAACIGLFKETSRVFAAVALILSIVSCMSYLGG